MTLYLGYVNLVNIFLNICEVKPCGDVRIKDEKTSALTIRLFEP